MKKIALEEHVRLLTEPSFNDLKNQIEESLAIYSGRSDTERFVRVSELMSLSPVLHRIPEMDKAGIEIQILSSGDGFIHNDPDSVRAATTAMIINDRLYGLSQEYPGRFKCFGILALQDPVAAADEVQRIHDEYGFLGVMVYGTTLGHFYDEAQFEPVWNALEKKDMVFFLHPGFRSAVDTVIYDGYPELLASTWDWGVYGGTHALRLVFGGVFERHPGVKLILGHMGEHLPYVLARLDEGAGHRGIPEPGGRISRPPSYYIKNNIYIATSGRFAPGAMACAMMEMGAEHILFACDYPNLDVQTSIEQIEECDFLSDSDKSMIYRGSAEKLFGI